MSARSGIDLNVSVSSLASSFGSSGTVIVSGSKPPLPDMHNVFPTSTASLKGRLSYAVSGDCNLAFFAVSSVLTD